MPRRKLSEYRAKMLLSPNYRGTTIHLSSLKADVARLSPNLKYIVKVDQGVKKRGKQGLIRLDVARDAVEVAVKELAVIAVAALAVGAGGIVMVLTTFELVEVPDAFTARTR